MRVIFALVGIEVAPEVDPVMIWPTRKPATDPSFTVLATVLTSRTLPKVATIVLFSSAAVTSPVRGALSVTVLPLMLVIVVPVGIPVPETDMPTTSPETDGRVSLFDPSAAAVVVAAKSTSPVTSRSKVMLPSDPILVILVWMVVPSASLPVTSMPTLTPAMGIPTGVILLPSVWNAVALYSNRSTVEKPVTEL